MTNEPPETTGIQVRVERVVVPVVCACCGKTEDEHHAFIPVRRPLGCRCSVTDWRDNQRIPPVCAKYKSATGGNCDTCEHDENCHKA